MKRLGVFICHCGINIAGTVDAKSGAEKIGGVEDVAHSTDYIYMCSEPGQQIIREAVREKGLGGVVVACCSPNMHENTFRKAVQSTERYWWSAGELPESLLPSISLKEVMRLSLWRGKLPWEATWPNCQELSRISIPAPVESSQRHRKWRSIQRFIFTAI